MNFDRLRSLLLEQAIRGELVEQQAIDFAVPVVDGVLPKESYPFEIPDHWKWYPLGKIVEYGKCTQIGSGEISETTWVLDLEDIEKGTGRLVNKKRGTLTTSNKAKFCKGDVLYGKLRPYLNKVLIADEDGVCTTEIVPISVVTAKLPLLAEYLQSYLMSPFFLDYANKISYGVKMPRLGTKDAKAALIPVPPVEEQARIVAKLEEAFSEIDRAEKAYEELQTLAGVLRGQILQEAIEGKLVPQLAEEGVVEQIGAAPEEVPFEIPEKWKWYYLGSVIEYGKSNQVSGDEITSQTWVLDLEDIEKNTGRILEKKRGVPSTSNKNKFESGYVLYSKLRPYLNKVVVADEAGVCTTEIVPINVNGASVPLDAKYLQTYLMSPFFVNYANQASYGVKMPRLGTKDARAALIPIPPLEEQKRIVQKVVELLSQTDSLAGC